MNSLPLGLALEQIGMVLGERVSDATVIDAQTVDQHSWFAMTETYNMEHHVYVRNGWLERGRKTGVFLLMRLGDNPMIVSILTEPKPIVRNDNLPLTAVEIDHEGHRFDPIDMFWKCECGEILEADSLSCNQCKTSNPFLGMLL